MSDLIETMIRTIVSVFLLMTSIHIIGRQIITHMTYLHYIVSITLGSIAANLAFETNLNFFNLVVCFVIFVVISVLLSRFGLKSYTLKKWIMGKPITLIEKGKILEHNLDKINMSMEVLAHNLRKKDIFDINEVEFAVLERDGGFSVLKKAMYQPVTRQDLSFQKLDVSFPVELIVDGEMLIENITKKNLTMEWLDEELVKRNLEYKDVNYMVLGTNNQLYIDLYQDNLK
jgi:uncharacterized membrane protein YcaP (DUF421 family)